MPAVSIVMPVYNVEKFIKKSILSVLKQTFSDFELIIVNDGSADSSMDVANQYAVEDNRILIVNKSNGGLSDARNEGLKNARGEYILFLDSDDEISEKLLEITVKKIRESNADLVMFGYHKDTMNKDEKLLYSNKIKILGGTYTQSEKKRIEISSELLDLMGYAWNKLYNRKFIIDNDISFEKGLSLIEDIVFNKKALIKATKISILEETLYHYKQRNRKSLVNTFRLNTFELQMRAIECRKEILMNWRIDLNILEKNIANLHVNAIRSSCSNLFFKKNQLNINEKYMYIKRMLENNLSRERINNFYPENTGDFFLKFIIKNKLALLLTIISNIYLKGRT